MGFLGFDSKRALVDELFVERLHGIESLIQTCEHVASVDFSRLDGRYSFKISEDWLVLETVMLFTIGVKDTFLYE